MTEEVHVPKRKRSQPPGWRTPPADTEPRRPACLFCQYDLMGFEIGQACPECGNEISTLFADRRTDGFAKLGLILGICTATSMVTGIVFKTTSTGTYTMAAGDVLTCLTIVLSVGGLGVSVPAMRKGIRQGWSFGSKSMRSAVIGVLLSLAPGLLATLIFVFVMLSR